MNRLVETAVAGAAGVAAGVVARVRWVGPVCAAVIVYVVGHEIGFRKGRTDGIRRSLETFFRPHSRRAEGAG